MATVTIEVNGEVKVYEVDANKLSYVRRVLWLDDPYAMKLWSVKDITDCFESKYGRAPSSEEVNRIFAFLHQGSFEDATDEEWTAIEDAIYRAMR